MCVCVCGFAMAINSCRYCRHNSSYLLSCYFRIRIEEEEEEEERGIMYCHVIVKLCERERERERMEGVETISKDCRVKRRKGHSFIPDI